MGLPHRNYSVFKQAHINQWEIKERDPPSAVGGLKGIEYKWWRLEPWLAKRRALFPEGRGLGVGGRKEKPMD